MKYLCPYCREIVDAASELFGQQVECPHCGSEFILPDDPPEIKQAAHAPLKFRYTTMVIRFDRKSFAIRNDDLLQGLSEESASRITHLGNEGWELVAVLPSHGDKSGFMLSISQTSSVDSAIAFFKRQS